MPLLKKAEMPQIRFHDLRRTCATILLMAGKQPKYVQELLGHASIKITLDTYSHIIEGMDGGRGHGRRAVNARLGRYCRLDPEVENPT
jgi:integrase